METAKQLQRGLEKLHISLTALQQQQLLTLLAWLQKWNKAYNLTAITDPSKQVSYHLLDSLAVLPHLKASRLLDVGTGPGFPGLPIAIAWPDCDVTLLDSNSKKTRFITQLVAHLGLTNVKIVHNRAETFSTDIPFDAIISRAVSSVSQLIEWSKQHCSCDGRYYLLKGEQPELELAGLALPAQVISLAVPGITRERHLVIVDNKDAS